MADSWVHVLPEHLIGSAAAVDGHAFGLRETHALADRRTDSALPSLPSLAGAALP